jgi:hypothetical protein
MPNGKTGPGNVWPAPPVPIKGFTKTDGRVCDTNSKLKNSVQEKIKYKMNRIAEF